MTIGIVPRPMYQPSQRVELAAKPLVAERLQPGRRDSPEVAPEVEDDRGHRAELDHRRERCTGIVPTEERRDDAQVSGRGDRQEFGEALHDAEDDGLEGTHPSTVTACPRLLE